MTEKRKYEKPSSRVIELRQRMTLLSASNPEALANPEDYEDGGDALSF